MRRTTLLLGALLVTARTASAQTALQAANGANPPPVMGDHAAPAQLPVQPTENLTTFDGARAELVWRDWTWKLMVDGVLIKDFGRREIEARQALRLVRTLGLTQHGTVGA